MDNMNETMNMSTEPVNPSGPANFELASAGDRFVAALIDGLLCGLVSFIPVLGMIASIGYSLTKDALPFLDGQSIGKKAMKIRVLDAATGAPITNKYDKAAIRALSLIIPIFGFVDALMVLIDAERKRFGDKWANTVVVKLPN
jgi:uncharacterized RDD family membrane protein YckC